MVILFPTIRKLFFLILHDPCQSVLRSNNLIANAMHYTTYIKETLYRFCGIQTLVYISDILYVSVCYYSLLITQLDRLTD